MCFYDRGVKGVLSFFFFWKRGAGEDGRGVDRKGGCAMRMRRRKIRKAEEIKSRGGGDYFGSQYWMHEVK